MAAAMDLGSQIDFVKESLGIAGGGTILAVGCYL